MFLRKENNTMRWGLIAAWGIMAAIVCALGVMYFDRPIHAFLINYNYDFWHILDRVFDDKIWVLFFAVLVGVVYIKNSIKSKTNILFLIKRFKFREILRDFWQKTKNSNVFFIFCSIMAAGVITWPLKVLIGRARPVMDLWPAGVYGFFPPSLQWEFNSMPSGHTAVSFAALVMIGLLVPRVRIITWSLAILIAVSRLCIGAHWPSDVIFGATIGMIMADVVYWAMVRYAQRNA